jgi:hypothetical protein
VISSRTPLAAQCPSGVLMPPPRLDRAWGRPSQSVEHTGQVNMALGALLDAAFARIDDDDQPNRDTTH